MRGVGLLGYVWRVGRLGGNKTGAEGGSSSFSLWKFCEVVARFGLSSGGTETGKRGAHPVAPSRRTGAERHRKTAKNLNRDFRNQPPVVEKSLTLLFGAVAVFVCITQTL